MVLYSLVSLQSLRIILFTVVFGLYSSEAATLNSQGFTLSIILYTSTHFHAKQSLKQEFTDFTEYCTILSHVTCSRWFHRTLHEKPHLWLQALQVSVGKLIIKVYIYKFRRNPFPEKGVIKAPHILMYLV